MDKLERLTKLHDIHLPPTIGWWPMAYGWYVLLIILLLITSLLIAFWYRRYHYSRAKKQACKLLHTYEQEYQRQGNAAITCAKISELLRRVALAYFPRQKVANLQGEAWINFLNQTAKNINFNDVRQHLLEFPYQNQVQEINLKPLFTRAYAWIKQRGIPC